MTKRAPATDPASPKTAADRRSDFRMLTTLRVGKITCNGEQELCLIRNISHGGLMLRVFADRAVGEEVTVELKSDCVVSGTVTWAKDESVGVAFDEPVDALEVLRTDPLPGGHIPRPPRLDLNTRAKLRMGDAEWTVELRDLSQGGAKVKLQDSLIVGDEAVLIVPGLKPLKAIVRWQVDGNAGLAFIGTLPLAELVEWLNARRGIGRRPVA